MNALTFRILLVFAIINSSLIARAVNPPEEMLSAGRVDETIAALNRQISATPNDPGLSNLLCRAYYQLQEWNEAESFCQKAVSLDPENSDFHLWLGRVYGEKANRTNFVAAASLAAKVHAEFERAVQLNAKSLDARLDLTPECPLGQAPIIDFHGAMACEVNPQMNPLAKFDLHTDCPNGTYYGNSERFRGCIKR